MKRNQPKEWWAPIFRGLVMDPQAKHYRRMGSALWLFIYLILGADRDTGRLFRKLTTSACDMGINARTVRRWLKTLRDQGYITTRRTGRSLDIQINRWKGTGRLWKSPGKRSNSSSQSDTVCPIRAAKSDRPNKALQGRNTTKLRRKPASRFFPNERTITKDLLDIDIDNKNLLASHRHTLRDFRLRTREELLASDIAKALNDYPGLPLYLSFAKKYQETWLRQVLSEVKAVPKEKIKRSRGALFNFLIQQHAKKISHDSRS